VSFTQREPDTRSVAEVSGQTCDDRLMSQPSDPCVQKQDRHLPQKCGLHSTFGNTAEKLIPQTSLMPANDRFRTQAIDSKFLRLLMLTFTLFVEILYYDVAQ